MYYNLQKKGITFIDNTLKNILYLGNIYLLINNNSNFDMNKIKSNVIHLLLFLSIIITGCTSANLSILKDIKIKGERIISLDTEPAPWNVKIIETITKKGFKVLTSGKSLTRFVLQISASAPTNPMHRCFAGGWKFDYYTATVVDLIKKENIASVEGSGYSEDCEPSQGKIFTLTAQMLDGLWSDNGQEEQHMVEEIDENRSNDDKILWDLIKDSDSEDSFRQFIKKFPNSSLSIAAQFRLDKLKNKKESSVVKVDGEKPRAVLVPIGTIGPVSKTQKNIILNKFLDELSNNYILVPQEEYEKAEEKAFQELDFEECTEEQCIRVIQEMLQVENMFKIEMIREDKDTQVSLTLIVLDKKLVKTDFCENCKTQSLIKLVSKLYKELESKR